MSAARTLSVSAQYINSARRIQGRHSRASILGSEAWTMLDSSHVITTPRPPSPPPSFPAKQSTFSHASVSSQRVLGRFKPPLWARRTDTPRETCAGVTVRGFTLIFCQQHGNVDCATVASSESTVMYNLCLSWEQSYRCSQQKPVLVHSNTLCFCCLSVSLSS